MHVSTYLSLLLETERSLAASYRVVGAGHAAEVDVPTTCTLLAGQCDEHVAALGPVMARFDTDHSGGHRDDQPERLHLDGLIDTRAGGVGLLRDLHDLYALCSFTDLTWTMIGQAARGLRDTELLQVVAACENQTAVQLAWLSIRMKAAAPQALLVDPPVQP